MQHAKIQEMQPTKQTRVPNKNAFVNSPPQETILSEMSCCAERLSSKFHFSRGDPVNLQDQQGGGGEMMMMSNSRPNLTYSDPSQLANSLGATCQPLICKLENVNNLSQSKH